MTTIFYVFVFVASCYLLVLASKWLIDSLNCISRYLGWKEFVVAFFTVSLGAVAPEFFVGIMSAKGNVPELAFGNILGQNILILSLTVGVCAVILKKGIEVESKIVKTGATFAMIAAILPLVLIWDGVLSRADGVVLLFFFIFFITWLFSKKERFMKIYEEKEEDIMGVKCFCKKLGWALFGILLVVLAAHGIVESSIYFSGAVNASIPIIGILVVAAGVGLPETYFATTLAKRGQSWMILGGLIGAVTISSTLVLGVVSMIQPIILDVSANPSFLIARMFLVFCALTFLFFIRTGRRLSTKEGLFLILVYFTFVIVQIIIN